MIFFGLKLSGSGRRLSRTVGTHSVGDADSAGTSMTLNLIGWDYFPNTHPV